MRNEKDTFIIERMIKYCDDIEELLGRFDRRNTNVEKRARSTSLNMLVSAMNCRMHCLSITTRRF